MPLIGTVYAVANATVQHPDGGMTIPVRKGQHWPAEDPIVAAHPDLFSADPRWGMQYTREPAGYGDPPYEAPVEQATREPGEKRNVRRVEQRG